MKRPTKINNDAVYRQLDQITMSAPQREHAKAQMHAAEDAVEAIARILAEIRAAVGSTKRGALVVAQRARS